MLSKLIAKYARSEKRYISDTKYTMLYSVACVVRVCEVLAVFGVVYGLMWGFLFVGTII